MLDNCANENSVEWLCKFIATAVTLKRIELPKEKIHTILGSLVVSK